MDEPIELQDILKDVVKGENIIWDGAFCFYKNIEIMTVFGDRQITLVWVRQSIPDSRDKGLLKPEHPQFFSQLKAAVKQAKQAVDEAEETSRAMADLRNHLMGKPASGPVA